MIGTPANKTVFLIYMAILDSLYNHRVCDFGKNVENEVKVFLRRSGLFL